MSEVSKQKWVKPGLILLEVVFILTLKKTKTPQTPKTS